MVAHLFPAQRGNTARRRALGAVCTLLVALLMTFPAPARAITTETEAELTETQQLVEDSAAALDEANEDLETIEGQISEIEDKIAEIEEQLPEAQEEASEAMVELYHYDKSVNSFLSLILGSESFDEVITTLKYLQQIEEESNAAVDELNEMQSELETQMTALDAAKAQAESDQEAAEEALEEAQELREEAQAKADEEAAAEEEAAALAEAAAEADAAETVTVDISAVDWTLDEETFVEEWGTRIDAYLEGSPLEGYGTEFAQAAWTYGVDPRWSPAIACMESSKGANCFRSYNAWGWGYYSWSSWEEAIDAHVSGLARVYGYTISVDAAQTYCPPNWYVWYTTVASEMNKI